MTHLARRTNQSFSLWALFMTLRARKGRLSPWRGHMNSEPFGSKLCLRFVACRWLLIAVLYAGKSQQTWVACLQGTFLSGVRGAVAGDERLARVVHAGTMAPLGRACTGMLRALPPRKLTAPLDIASAAFTVSLSTRRRTVTCCSEFLAGIFRAAAASEQISD